MIYALINGGIVVNTIVAEPDFISNLENDFDSIVEISQDPGSPGIGWSYDGSNFTPPGDNTINQDDNTT